MFNQLSVVGQPIWVVPDTKFNEVSVSLKILFPLRKETATVANVLSKIMSDRLIMNDSKLSMTKRLDEMYGARLGVRTYSMGNAQLLDITVRTIDSKYVTEDLLKMQFDLVLDVLKRPLISEETFTEATKNVYQELLRIKENPQYFAILQALALAGENQPCGVQPEGTFEELQGLKLEDVQTFHQACVETFEKQVIVVGDVKEEDIPDGLIVENTARTPILSKTNFEPRYLSKPQNSNQTELVTIFETPIDPNHELYIPYLVYLAVLGQGSSSLLFQTVREKHSLCYSIHASQLIFDGIFYVQTSINPENEERVLSLIDEQMNLIKEGVFDIESSIAYLVNQISGTTEDLGRLGQFVFRNNVLSRDDSPESMVNAFKAVTKEDVMAVSEYIGAPFVFSYKGETYESNSK